MKYLLADNQAITKAGMRYYIGQADAEAKIEEVSDKKTLLTALKEDSNVVLIIDYTLMDFENDAEVVNLQAGFKETQWLFFSIDLSEDFIRTIIVPTQKFSILMKDGEEEEIRYALKSLLRIERYICQHATNLVLKERPNTKEEKKDVLTPTEKEILKEIALGKTTKEIAAERFLSFHTVNTHRKNIFRKLGINNVHDATKYAIKCGIIDIAEYCI